MSIGQTIVGASGDSITGTAGNDTITVTPSVANWVDAPFTHIQPGAGNDVLKLDAVNSVVEFGAGAGNDTILMSPVAKLRIEVTGTVKPSDVTVSIIQGEDRAIKDPWGSLSTTPFQAYRLILGQDSLLIDAKYVPGHGPEIYFASTGETFNASTWTGPKVTNDVFITEGSQWQSSSDLVGGAGNDRLTTYSNSSKSIIGGAGNDTLTSSQASCTLLGGLGDDVLVGGAGHDLLQGDAGADTYRLSHGNGNDTIRADGQDAIDLTRSGILRSQVHIGKLGAITANAVRLTIDNPNGDEGSITLENAGQWDGLVVSFADGSSLTGSRILATASLPPLQQVTGTANADTLTAVGNVYVDGGAGDDLINSTLQSNLTVRFVAGGADIDTVKLDQAASAGTSYPAKVIEVDAGLFREDMSARAAFTVDPVTGVLTNANRLFVYGGARSGGLYVEDQALWTYHFLQDDTVANIGVSTPPDRTFIGTSGNDSISMTANDLSVVKKGYGGDGNDTIAAFSRGAMVLSGDAGDDVLLGSEGFDTLRGGTGNDYLDGKASGDLYRFLRGWGQDTIVADTQDSIQLGSDILRSDLTFSLQGASVIIGIKGTQDSITLPNLGNWDGLTLKLGDGSAMSGVEVIQQLGLSDLAGTTGNDSLQGSSLAERLQGLAGDDTLLGAGGNDLLSGGVGQDLLDGGQGDDWLDGGLGNDTLIGGGGSNQMNGGAAADVFVISNDDTKDVLTVTDGDIIRFGPGVKAADVRFVMRATDTMLAASFDPTAGQVVITRDAATPGLTYSHDASTSSKLTLTFDDGVSISGSVMSGTTGNDVLSYWGNVRPGGGDDLILPGFVQTPTGVSSGAIHTAYELGDGLDTVKGLAGVDNWVSLGSGINPSDLVIGAGSSMAHILLRFANAQGGLDVDNLGTIDFFGGPVWTQADFRQWVEDADNLLTGTGGNDSINGGAGNDTLIGGAGSDTLTGGAGADVYEFDMTSGNDLVHADGQDTLLIHGVSSTGLSIGKLGATGADIEVLSLQGGGTLTLDQFSTLNGLQLRFDDGKTLAWSAIQAVATKVDNLTLTGTTKADALTGKDGNDTLSGLAGNDTLAGGKGNDSLIGGKGNDTYLFNRGEGQDVIVDNDSTWFNSDLLKVGGATSKQLWLTKSGNNLDIKILGTTDKVTVQNWFAGSANQVEKITASDGKSLSAAKVQALVNAMDSFTPPADGLNLPANTPTAVTKLIASSWA